MNAFELLKLVGEVEPADPAVLDKAAAGLLARCGTTAGGAAGRVAGSGDCRSAGVPDLVAPEPDRPRQGRRIRVSRVRLRLTAGVAAAAAGWGSGCHQHNAHRASHRKRPPHCHDRLCDQPYRARPGGRAAGKRHPANALPGDRPADTRCEPDAAKPQPGRAGSHALYPGHRMVLRRADPGGRIRPQRPPPPRGRPHHRDQAAGTPAPARAVLVNHATHSSYYPLSMPPALSSG